MCAPLDHRQSRVQCRGIYQPHGSVSSRGGAVLVNENSKPPRRNGDSVEWNHRIKYCDVLLKSIRMVRCDVISSTSMKRG